MIIDNHIHIFPDQGGPEVGPDPARHVAQLQKTVVNFWGRMVSSHVDAKFIPEPGEDVGFKVGSTGGTTDANTERLAGCSGVPHSWT